MIRYAIFAALLLAPLGVNAQTVTPAGAGITSLTGDCTGSGPGATATTCTKTGGVAFGTAATVNTGTSGATIPLLNGTNTASGRNIISAAGATSSPALLLNGAPFTGTGTTAWPLLLVQPSGTTSTNWNGNGNMLGVNAASGFVGNLISLQANGTILFTINAAGTAANAGDFSAATITANTNLVAPAAGQIAWSGRTGMLSPATNMWSMGGITSSFPAWKRVSATWAARLADDSGDAAISASTATFSAVASDTATTDATACIRSSDGLLLKGTGTLGICLGTSSARFKHGIAPLAAGLSEIMRLRPVSYYLNADHGDPSKLLYGFTAEDMQPVLPKLVGLDAKGAPNTADYLGLVPVLVRAVQQLQGEVEALKSQIVTGNLIMARLP